MNVRIAEDRLQFFFLRGGGEGGMSALSESRLDDGDFGGGEKRSTALRLGSEKQKDEERGVRKT